MSLVSFVTLCNFCWLNNVKEFYFKFLYWIIKRNGLYAIIIWMRLLKSKDLALFNLCAILMFITRKTNPRLKYTIICFDHWSYIITISRWLGWSWIREPMHTSHATEVHDKTAGKVKIEWPYLWMIRLRDSINVEKLSKKLPHCLSFSKNMGSMKIAFSTLLKVL